MRELTRWLKCITIGGGGVVFSSSIEQYEQALLIFQQH
jgi:hypothetical protein